MNLPLALTLSRIVLTPVILVCLIPGELTWNVVGAVLLIIASVTDYFDGYYARKLNLVTNTGKFLDPLADKILVSAILIFLVKTSQVDPWMVILFITRDTLIGGIRSIAAADNIIIAAKSAGKWKAALQMIALPLIILGEISPNIPNQKIGYWILWISVVLSWTSGYEYFRAFQKGKVNS